MSEVAWRLAHKRDRAALQGFTCCPAVHKSRMPCPVPWAHEVQSYFRDPQQALASCNRYQATFDQRMILVFDGPALAGAAVHALTVDDDPDGTRERSLVAFAVATGFQRKEMSDQRRASTTILDAVVSDITSRHPDDEAVNLLALVDPRNAISNSCLSRYGILPRGRDDSGEYILHAGRIC